MKKILSLLTAYMLLSGAFIWAQNITVSVDTNSTYTPTHILNGSFENTSVLPGGENGNGPIRKGIGEGWGTTDSYGFEVSGDMGTYGWSGYTPAAGSYFVEMNGGEASIMYQDLTTHPNDVIRWTLAHAARTGAEIWKNPQTMHVEIGEPNGSYPTNQTTNIKELTKGIFRHNGVSGYNAVDTNGLSALQVYKTAGSSAYSSKVWYKAVGVYIIPAGQTVTRFAFISDDTDCPGGGNLLDDVTFETLIGNLNAYAEWDSTVVVTGYWGETDTSKKLIVRVGDTDNSIDMSSVSKKNFKIVIAQNVVGEAPTVKIYHQDYETAAKTVNIERHYHDGVLYGVWNYSDRLPTTGRYALGTDVTLAGDVTLTGDAAMNDKGGAKICLNGHTISGGKLIINSGTNKVSIENVSEETKKTVSSDIVVNGGDFTVNGANLSTLTINNGTCTVTGLVTISSLALASGKVLTLGSNLNVGSTITLTATPNTGVITSGFESRTLGQIISLPSAAKNYVLMKTKSGELKVTQHKSGW